jgi:RNA polymerase sigma-70 factor (ECF subfamily)
VNEAEVAEVFAKYGHIVLRRCRYILRESAAADDALQEVFVRLWRYGDGFREAEAKVPWLHRVADRCCFDQLALRADRREPIPSEDASSLPDAARSVEDRDLVQKILDRFDDETKQMALMYWLDELSYEQIGAALGLTRQTVSTRWSWLKAAAQRYVARVDPKESPR